MSAVQYNHEINEQDFNVTETARQKMGELLADVDDDIQAIRIYVSGGGCSGMNYGMTFTDQIHTLDNALQTEKFNLVIDPIALNFLRGAEIDYVDDGVSATFVFNNVFQAVGGSGACTGCGAAGAH